MKIHRLWSSASRYISTTKCTCWKIFSHRCSRFQINRCASQTWNLMLTKFGVPRHPALTLSYRDNWRTCHRSLRSLTTKTCRQNLALSKQKIQMTCTSNHASTSRRTNQEYSAPSKAWKKGRNPLNSMLQTLNTLYLKLVAKGRRTKHKATILRSTKQKVCHQHHRAFRHRAGAQSSSIR